MQEEQTWWANLSQARPAEGFHTLLYLALLLPYAQSTIGSIAGCA
jgi:hypothetical protein